MTAAYAVPDVVVTVARWLFGLTFLAGGINELLRSVRIELVSIDLGRAAGRELIAALRRAPVIWGFLHLVEAVAGALLLLDVAVPFALVLVAPVAIGIALFHLTLSGLWWVAPALLVPGVVLAVEHWHHYAPLFTG